MTTTSVKDVGSVMNLGIRAGGAAAKAGVGTFQTVWSSQAGANKSPQQNQTAEKVSRADDKAKPGDDLRAKDSSRTDLREDEETQVQKSRGKADRSEAAQGEMSEEDLELAMEAVAAAAMDLIGQIADTFGIPVETVQDLMADMNLQPVDLLQPENLSNLLLEAGGAQDSLSLLTNEQLYSDYQMLMEQGQAALETVSEETGIPPMQILQMAEEPETLAAVEEEEPDLQFVAEDDGNETFVQQPDAEVTEDVQPLRNAQESTGGRDARDTKHDGEGKSGDTGGNLTLQLLRNEAYQPQMEAVQETSSPWDVDTQDMMRQIMDYMRLQVKPDMSSLEMQLHPASLGTLQIHVASRGGVLTANFVTQNEAVKAALESQMVQLKESFAEQGVKVEAIEVTVQTHQFEQNLEQGRGRQPQDTAEGKRPRTRRITLGGADGTDIPEQLEEEDRIAAEMMAANGGTVDFTA